MGRHTSNAGVAHKKARGYARNQGIDSETARMRLLKRGVPFGVPGGRRVIAPQRRLKPTNNLVQPGREIRLKPGESIEKALKRLKKPEIQYTIEKRSWD